MALMGKARIFGTTLVGGTEVPGGGHLVSVSAVAPCGPFAVEGTAQEGAIVTGKVRGNLRFRARYKIFGAMGMMTCINILADSTDCPVTTRIQLPWL